MPKVNICYNLSHKHELLFILIFMKMMEEPRVMTGGPVEAPEKTEAEVTQQEALARSDERGGVRIEEAVKGSPDPVEDASKLMAEAVRKDLDVKMDTAPAKTEVKEKPVDVSELRNYIAQFESAEQGFFKKMFTDKKETLRLLKLGLGKITNPDPKFKVYANRYNRAMKEGGIKFAAKYAEAIGNGELVEPVDGVLMVTGKSSQRDLFPQ